MIPVRTGVPFHGLSPSDSLSSIISRSGVIVSIGASNTLVGPAGEAEPRWIIRTEFHHPDTPGIIYSYLGILELLKNEATRRFGSEAVSAFVEQLFMRYLLVNPDSVKIVILENMLYPYRFKHCLAEILFRRFKAPLLEFIPAQPLALVPLSRKTALVVDVGYTESTILPVVTNTALTRALQSQPQGALAIHQMILTQLKSYACALPAGYILEEGVDSDADAKPLTHEVDALVLEDLCRQLCFVSARGSSSTEGPQYIPYIDRFGRLYRINRQVRATAADALFIKSDEEYASLPETILRSIMACDLDLRIKLAHKILLVGGVSLMRGFATRLLQELEHLVCSDKKFETLLALSGHFELVVTGKFYTPHLSWIGASIDCMIEGAHTANQIQYSDFIHSRKPLPDWSSVTAH